MCPVQKEQRKCVMREKCKRERNIKGVREKCKGNEREVENM